MHTTRKCYDQAMNNLRRSKHMGVFPCVYVRIYSEGVRSSDFLASPVPDVVGGRIASQWLLWSLDRQHSWNLLCVPR